MEFVVNNVPLVSTLVGVLGIVFAIVVAGMVKSAPAGNEKMQKIASAIQEGAIAYLNRQMKSMGIAGIIIFIVIYSTMGAKTALGFLIGAVASFCAGYIGMRVSVIANVRTAEASKNGMAAGLNMAFKGGSVTGMIVAGLALTAVAGYYTVTHDVIALVALGFGGSLISIFARLGGGIFTKGADVGADLVGKVEAGIPEDDPRNPATIADNVGDNVGDCAGMAADLFETYAVTIVAAMLIGHLLFPEIKMATEFPLILGSISVCFDHCHLLCKTWQKPVHHGRSVQKACSALQSLQPSLSTMPALNHGQHSQHLRNEYLLLHPYRPCSYCRNRYHH
ncbi:MAG: sodium/proton-translocating pyrophosphatase [Desulfobacterales bacterium]